MKIVIFTHPADSTSFSMPRFAKMIGEGMVARRHEVEYWTSPHFFSSINAPQKLRKWLSYIDQFLIFGLLSRFRVAREDKDTLFVFSDQALGPWVPPVRNRPHVIHVHDFMALKSAQGKFQENITGITGRLYQRFIQLTFSQGRNFISVSQKTKQDLDTIIKKEFVTSVVVYNGLNKRFRLKEPSSVRKSLAEMMSIELDSGYILHVGGNQWYKNRIGVIEIYNAWRERTVSKLPLVMIGAPPSESIRKKKESSPYKDSIHFMIGLDDEVVADAYAGASVFIFPSLAEGFGWPIAEAMASGCPVITTGVAPMTEVAGEAAVLIPRRPVNEAQQQQWAIASSRVVEEIVNLAESQRRAMTAAGNENIKKFDVDDALDQIEKIYIDIVASAEA